MKWASHELPINEALESLESLFFKTTENLRLLKNTNKKLLIHCKGGIGRTGTTIAILNAILTVKE
jgi:protein-tyrosine phosphatase